MLVERAKPALSDMHLEGLAPSVVLVADCAAAVRLSTGRVSGLNRVFREFGCAENSLVLILPPSKAVNAGQSVEETQLHY